MFTLPKLLLRLCVERRRLKKLCLTSFPDISFLVALNCAVANSSARALLGIVPFCTSWLLRPVLTFNVFIVDYQPALGPRGGLWPILLMCNP
jgi:hypothetical protein